MSVCILHDIEISLIHTNVIILLALKKILKNFAVQQATVYIFYKIIQSAKAALLQDNIP